MAFPLIAAAFYAAGTITQMQGQAQADEDQADAADRNASFFREQAAFIEIAGKRELSIFQRGAENTISALIGAYARSAVDSSGSAIQVIAEQEQLILAEGNAIKADTAHRKRLAILRAQDSSLEADRIKSTSGQRQFATLLGGSGSIAGAASKTTFSGESKGKEK